MCIRDSYYFIGALLGKYKSAEVPLPGGCNIGSRPIDQHLKGFRALGARIDIERGAVVAHAIDLVGGHIYLDVVSVGATINIMMAAALAEGKTTIENAAKEPHVVDVDVYKRQRYGRAYLRSCGGGLWQCQRLCPHGILPAVLPMRGGSCHH